MRGRRVHFMGIGGIGVSALARLARAAGAVITGCDRKPSANAEGLAREGVGIWTGHSPDHLAGVDMVVHTGAVRPDEPELVAARAAGIEVVDRLPMLLRLAEGRRLLGVAGSHGKTTTTSFIATLLVEEGLDPSCAIGGVAQSLGGNMRAGNGDWFVAEIDESDGHIAEAACQIAVLTNVDREHFDHYADFAAIRSVFARFLSNTAHDGTVLVCADCGPAVMLAQASGKRTVTYGLSSGADYCAANVRLASAGSRFDAVGPGKTFRDLDIALPGIHLVQNAAAAVAVACILGLDEAALRRALAGCSRIGRRFETHALPRGVRMVVDYAHHPAEVAATVAAARIGNPGRVVAVFQPHRYTRTMHLGEEFGPAFAGFQPAHLEGRGGGRTRGVDDLIVLPIYAASEDQIPGVTGEVVARSARRAGVESARYVESRAEAVAELARVLAEGDTLLVLGAGDVDAVGEELRALL